MTDESIVAMHAGMHYALAIVLWLWSIGIDHGSSVAQAALCVLSLMHLAAGLRDEVRSRRRLVTLASGLAYTAGIVFATTAPQPWAGLLTASTGLALTVLAVRVSRIDSTGALAATDGGAL